MKNFLVKIYCPLSYQLRLGGASQPPISQGTCRPACEGIHPRQLVCQFVKKEKGLPDSQPSLMLTTHSRFSRS